MTLTLKNLSGEVKIDGRPVTPVPQSGPIAVSWPQLVETGVDGSVDIYSGTLLAAQVRGPDNAKRVRVPPTESFATTYYNSSYRWRLKAPGGSVGLRA